MKEQNTPSKPKKRTVRKPLTQEQIDWRNQILRKRVTEIKDTKQQDLIVNDDDEIKQCFWYLNNCVYWVNSYIDGEVDKKSLLKTARSFQSNAKKLENILLKLIKP